MTTHLKFGAVAALTLLAGPALAHHPLGGMPMETFGHGLLSGIGHPLLGFDHLFFVLAMGVAASLTGRAAMTAGAYIGAMLVGVLLMNLGVGLPLKEVVIALSLLGVGGILLSGRALGLSSAAILFAGFGLFHGSAFGDALAAQEAAMGLPVLIGYLLGLGVLQFSLAIAAAAVTRQIWKATDAQALQPRLAGAAVAGMGVLLSLEHVEGAAFAVMGWAG